MSLGVGAAYDKNYNDLYPRLQVASQPAKKSQSKQANMDLASAPQALADTDVTLTDASALVGATYNLAAYASANQIILPSAADVLAALEGAVVGTSFEFCVVNNGASGTATVVAGSGGSTLGNMDVVNARSGVFRVRVTGTDTAAYQVQRLSR